MRLVGTLAGFRAPALLFRRLQARRLGGGRTRFAPRAVERGFTAQALLFQHIGLQRLHPPALGLEAAQREVVGERLHVEREARRIDKAAIAERHLGLGAGKRVLARLVGHGKPRRHRSVGKPDIGIARQRRPGILRRHALEAQAPAGKREGNAHRAQRSFVPEDRIGGKARHLLRRDIALDAVRRREQRRQRAGIDPLDDEAGHLRLARTARPFRHGAHALAGGIDRQRHVGPACRDRTVRAGPDDFRQVDARQRGARLEQAVLVGIGDLQAAGELSAQPVARHVRQRQFPALPGKVAAEAFHRAVEPRPEGRRLQRHGDVGGILQRLHQGRPVQRAVRNVAHRPGDGLGEIGEVDRIEAQPAGALEDRRRAVERQRAGERVAVGLAGNTGDRHRRRARRHIGVQRERKARAALRHRDAVHHQVGLDIVALHRKGERAGEEIPGRKVGGALGGQRRAAGIEGHGDIRRPLLRLLHGKSDAAVGIRVEGQRIEPHLPRQHDRLRIGKAAVQIEAARLQKIVEGAGRKFQSLTGPESVTVSGLSASSERTRWAERSALS